MWDQVTSCILPCVSTAPNLEMAHAHSTTKILAGFIYRTPTTHIDTQTDDASTQPSSARGGDWHHCASPGLQRHP